MTGESETVVRAINSGFRPMVFDNNHQFGVVYEMQLDFTSHERKVYGFLDWLSDLGGLISALMAAFGVLLSSLFLPIVIPKMSCDSWLGVPHLSNFQTIYLVLNSILVIGFCTRISKKPTILWEKYSKSFIVHKLYYTAQNSLDF